MILGISKTTANGVLALLIVVFTVLTSFQIPPALQTPQNTHIMLWVSTVLTLLLAILRAVVGFLQNDAPPPAQPQPPNK